MREFDFIEKFMKPLAATAEGADAGATDKTSANSLGLQDDAAILRPRTGYDLVLSKDLIVEGVHFPEGEAGDVVARRALRTNLSDLAAMGAAPVGYLLGLARDGLDKGWLADFARGLQADQEEFGLQLLGGDTVAMPNGLCVSITILGEVPQGLQLTRAGARPRDDLYVSGTIGDAALGLGLLQGQTLFANRLSAEEADFLRDRYNCPQPRVSLGQALHGLATSGIDLSDGLVADCRHIAVASHGMVEIDPAMVPVSQATAKLLDADPMLWRAVLTGGDDYELAFTAAPEDHTRVLLAAEECGIAVTRIGRVKAGQGIKVLDHLPAGVDIGIMTGAGGYQHQ